MHDDFIEVQLEEEPIELCKLLKVLDLAEGGGHAKLLIADGYIGVNGEVCTQKRKKLYAGDSVYIDGETFLLSAADNMVQREQRKTSKPSSDKAKAPKPANKRAAKPAKAAAPAVKKPKKKTPTRDENTGRKPISFG
ncbi:RNA-binding S4 domain-containing protein [Pseudoalteromonas pernae]|uniref:RNA-binding S4 domain-containing protein n=1 Tax=Pseudoalteromonas pernae TaxID=3118054 RepID=UPI003241DFA8